MTGRLDHVNHRHRTRSTPRPRASSRRRSQRRAQRAARARARASRRVFAVVSLLAAVALALLADARPRRSRSRSPRSSSSSTRASQRVEFHVGDGYVVPTQLVFVPMLLLLPTPLVPLLVVARRARWPRPRRRRARRSASPQRLLLAINDAAFALAPAAVLVALDAQLPDWALWPAYVAGARRAVRRRRAARGRPRAR